MGMTAAAGLPVVRPPHDTACGAADSSCMQDVQGGVNSRRVSDCRAGGERRAKAWECRSVS